MMPEPREPGTTSSNLTTEPGNALSVKPAQGAVSFIAQPLTLQFGKVRNSHLQCADGGGATALEGAWMERSFPAQRAHPQRLAAGPNSS
jgi:hypothetical protein